MERCIEVIRHWVVSDRLRAGTMDIEPVNYVYVRNLGAWFDSMLPMEIHINKVFSSGFYYLHKLRK